MQQADLAAEESDMHPLILERLQKPRSIFSHGHRLRMNIVPMFLNTFIPWGVFVFCCGMTSFQLMYSHQLVVWGGIGLVFVIWLVSVVIAIQARRKEADPTWFTYFSVVFLVMAIAGTFTGMRNYNRNMKKYFLASDLKLAKGVDASATPGQSVLDAGIIEFRRGTAFDDRLSWHFKHGTLYCVAPILTNQIPPVTQTYDFWAVGKDCCAVGSSDFRCGSWGVSDAKSGFRLVDDGDTGYYRLAVQQAESLYNIMAPNPIFLEWSADPVAQVNSWNQSAFRTFCIELTFALVCNFFFLTMASVKYSWIGRRDSIYQTEYLNDPDWIQGYIQQQPMNYRSNMYY